MVEVLFKLGFTIAVVTFLMAVPGMAGMYGHDSPLDKALLHVAQLMIVSMLFFFGAGVIGMIFSK